MLSIIYTRRFSGKLLGPILHLTEITKTAWDAPDYVTPQMSDLLLGEGEQDETYILTHSFHHMLERLGKQMTELQEKARLEQQLRIDEAQREDRTGSCIIKEALSYIDQNYQKSVTLDSVADHVFLSPTYFSALFKKETGVNYIEYLTGIRINAAKKLLKKLDHSVTQVGESVGYKDPKQFRKQFIKSVGITPSVYRMSNMH
jgi:YesN/AraC family two-component response regulator